MSQPKGLMLLPPSPDVCQECATAHEADMPHNQQSLFYQMKFQMEHGRGPKWSDAIAHCSPEMKNAWRRELAKLGIEVLS